MRDVASAVKLRRYILIRYTKDGESPPPPPMSILRPQSGVVKLLVHAFDILPHVLRGRKTARVEIQFVVWCETFQQPLSVNLLMVHAVRTKFCREAFLFGRAAICVFGSTRSDVQPTCYIVSRGIYRNPAPLNTCQALGRGYCSNLLGSRTCA